MNYLILKVISCKTLLYEILYLIKIYKNKKK